MDTDTHEWRYKRSTEKTLKGESWLADTVLRQTTFQCANCGAAFEAEQHFPQLWLVTPRIPNPRKTRPSSVDARCPGPTAV